MSQRDDHQLDLQEQMLRAIGDEPAMLSLPEDDLARGRRLVRRRRFAAIAVTATAVPGLALGGWALSANLANGAAPGSDILHLQPADSSGTDATDTAPPTCAVVGVGGKLHGPHAGRLRATRGGARRQLSSPSAGSGRLSVGTQAGLQTDPACGSTSSGDTLGTVTSECDTTTPPATDGGSTGCLAVGGDPIATPEVDRITNVLHQDLDPDATHSGGDANVGVGGSVADGGQTTAVYVGMDWVDGDQTGTVSLSVEDSATAPPPPQCQDQSLPYGPPVSCVEQPLADGTTVLIGHGQQDGAGRVSVRYDRPDGTVVIATADQATERWWTDGSGSAPLASSPATVDQLINLVQDPGNHL